MKKIQFKTISKKQLADTVTPVGLYSKIRDKYANSLLLESSDYHSKEESFTFICIEPLLSLKANQNTFTYTYKNEVLQTVPIENNFYELFQEFAGTVQVNCDKEIL